MNLEYQARRRDLAQTAVIVAMNATHRTQIDDSPDDLEHLATLAEALWEEP